MYGIESEMEQIILVFHVLIALAIIGLILLQQGKGAEMGASFGAGASQTIFGAAGGGNALTKATAILVTLFFVTSFGLAIAAKTKVAGVGEVNFPAAVVNKVDNQDIPDAQDDGASASAVESDVPSMPAREEQSASENN